MLLILIACALVTVVAVLGLSMFRVAALSDRNSALALTEWIAASRLIERQGVPADRPGEQFLFDTPDKAFRAAGS
jgi:hypothetical protein